MTYVYNDPAQFKDDVLRGFAAAFSQYVQRVEGASGFVRAGGPLEGKVAVVVGGGSGHYPAFSGVVGPGFADGAVVGNIFTSPSTQDVTGRQGRPPTAGCCSAPATTPGTVMNFTLAQQRLIAEGVDTRVVFVTDDVASAPVEARSSGGAASPVTSSCSRSPVRRRKTAPPRRGGAGRPARERPHRTLGVAFAGCTMPGADHPLFEVPAGLMGFGLGIHGEPGISRAAAVPPSWPPSWWTGCWPRRPRGSYRERA